LASRFVFFYSLVTLTAVTAETSLASGSCRIDRRLSGLLNHDNKTKIERSKKISARKKTIDIKDAGDSGRKENENAALCLLFW
jgi:hypothetical protein